MTPKTKKIILISGGVVLAGLVFLYFQGQQQNAAANKPAPGTTPAQAAAGSLQSIPAPTPPASVATTMAGSTPVTSPPPPTVAALAAATGTSVEAFNLYRAQHGGVL